MPTEEQEIIVDDVISVELRDTSMGARVWVGCRTDDGTYMQLLLKPRDAIILGLEASIDVDPALANE